MRRKAASSSLFEAVKTTEVKMPSKQQRKLRASQLTRLSVFAALMLFVTRKWLISQSLVRQSICGDTALTGSDEIGHRKLVVEVSHGLGNRLRAYATASALSMRTGRTLELVWPSDVHLQADFSDLFEETEVTWHSKSFLECARESPAFIVYDYLENPVDWRVRKPVDDRSIGTTFVCSNRLSCERSY